jgi:hypothetical protein
MFDILVILIFQSFKNLVLSCEIHGENAFCTNNYHFLRTIYIVGILLLKVSC